MKVVAFSDTHLTKRLDKHKLKFLISIISDADKVIINGDLFDLYRSELKDILVAWDELFKLLSTKSVVLTLGNHDNLLKEQTTMLQSKYGIEVVDSFELKHNDIKYVFTHGHIQSPTLDMRYPKIFTSRLVISIHNLRNIFMVKLLGEKYFRYKSNENQLLKDIAKKSQTQKTIWVYGHTHVAEYAPEEKFINLGLIDYGLASFLEITDNLARLAKTKYK